MSSGDVQLELWFHQYKYDALSSVLEEQGASVEKRMQEMLAGLYAELVPHEVQQEISDRIDAEYAADRAAMEAERKFTALRVREDGTESFFQLDGKEGFLEVAKFVRQHLRENWAAATAALRRSTFARMEPVTAERYDQLLALRMEAPGKVTGVFDLDFDKRELSTVDADGWKTWSMQDVSTAIYHAYRMSHLKPERYMGPVHGQAGRQRTDLSGPSLRTEHFLRGGDHRDRRSAEFLSAN